MLRKHYWEVVDRETAERCWVIRPLNLLAALSDLLPENLVKAAEATALDLPIIRSVSPPTGGVMPLSIAGQNYSGVVGQWETVGLGRHAPRAWRCLGIPPRKAAMRFDGALGSASTSAIWLLAFRSERSTPASMAAFAARLRPEPVPAAPLLSRNWAWKLLSDNELKVK